MKKATYRDLAILFGITLLIFYPLFYTHYFYTDEIGQLRNYRPGSHYHMFVGLGRYITDTIFQFLFNSIDTIRQITRLRIFSLFGWMACIPVWYLILTRVCQKEELPRLLPFFTVLYLVCCPPFCVYVSWASCMELFIANTSGLLAGYTLYSQIKFLPTAGSVHKRMELSAMAVGWTLLFGVVSLFTYQNGFGCFLLPFLLHAIAKREWSRTLGAAIGIYLLTYLLYYALFRWQMRLWHIDSSERTGFSPAPLSKMAFFLVRPLATAFRFTWIAREDSSPALYISQSILLAWLLVNFYIHRSLSASVRLLYLAGIGCLLGLIYLPSLIAKENYASNRTLLGLDLAVFLLVFSTLLRAVRAEKYRPIMAALLGLFFVANAWYNFHYQFLAPVKKEYDQVRNYIETQYHPGITSVTFIRPPQQLFHDLYGVNISWDEFGVPSTFPQWVPEDFVRQVVWEKTGSRAAADSLVIANWPDEQAYIVSRPGPALAPAPDPLAPHNPASGLVAPGPHTLIIDVEKIMR
ncbi:MAG TPA: hypothetical protein VNS58_29340 [Puia sp.]|nr:hypothetical protein [Puia sp.]